MKTGDNVTNLLPPEVPDSMFDVERDHPVLTAIAGALVLIGTLWICHIWPAGWPL